MGADNSTSLDVIIRMIAEGRGAELTAEQIRVVVTEIRKLETEIKKIEGAGGRVSAAVDARLDALKASLAKIGDVQVASAAGEQLGEKIGLGLSTRVQAHLATIASRIAHTLTGVNLSGVGSAFLSGGAALGAGIAVFTAGIEIAIQKFKELKAEQQALNDLAADQRSAGTFTPESLQRLHDTAEAMADGKHKTAEWLKVLGDLTRTGADEATVGKLTNDVKILASLMGGDLKEATNAARDAAEGNYDALRKVGIVVDESLSSSEALAFIQRELALRFTEVGNAAVESAPKFRQMAIAARAVKEDLEGITAEAQSAADNVKELVDQLEKTRSHEIQIIDEKEKRDKKHVDADVAEHKLTPEQGDAQKLEIMRAAERERQAVNRKASEEQIARYQGVIDTAKDKKTETQDKFAEQKTITEGNEKYHEALRGRNQLTDDIAKLQKGIALLKEQFANATDPAEKRGLAISTPKQIAELNKQIAELAYARTLLDQQAAEAAKTLPPGRRNLNLERNNLKGMEGFTDEGGTFHEGTVSIELKKQEKIIQDTTKLLEAQRDKQRRINEALGIRAQTQEEENRERTAKDRDTAAKNAQAAQDRIKHQGEAAQRESKRSGRHFEDVVNENPDWKHAAEFYNGGGRFDFDNNRLIPAPRSPQSQPTPGRPTAQAEPALPNVDPAPINNAGAKVVAQIKELGDTTVENFTDIYAELNSLKKAVKDIGSQGRNGGALIG